MLPNSSPDELFIYYSPYATIEENTLKFTEAMSNFQVTKNEYKSMIEMATHSTRFTRRILRVLSVFSLFYTSVLVFSVCYWVQYRSFVHFKHIFPIVFSLVLLIFRKTMKYVHSESYRSALEQVMLSYNEGVFKSRQITWRLCKNNPRVISIRFGPVSRQRTDSTFVYSLDEMKVITPSKDSWNMYFKIDLLKRQRDDNSFISDLVSKMTYDLLDLEGATFEDNDNGINNESLFGLLSIDELVEIEHNLRSRTQKLLDKAAKAHPVWRSLYLLPLLMLNLLVLQSSWVVFNSLVVSGTALFIMLYKRVLDKKVKWYRKMAFRKAREFLEEINEAKCLPRGLCINMTLNLQYVHGFLLKSKNAIV